MPYLDLDSNNILQENGFKINAIREKFQEVGMAEAELYYSDIYGLEMYFDALKAKEADLEDVLIRVGEEKSRDKSRIGNTFLEQIHKNFWDEALGRY